MWRLLTGGAAKQPQLQESVARPPDLAGRSKQPVRRMDEPLPLPKRRFAAVGEKAANVLLAEGGTKHED